ncbi:MAG: hypothetical protein V3V33_10025 [Candidatus Lokiarchaeia archaeon]
MENKKGNPKFSELQREPIPWDPAPDIRQFLDENKLKEVTRLQINYRIQEMKIRLEFMEKMEKLI